MEYINGKMAGAHYDRPLLEKPIDSRRYLSEMTWPEYEKYLKSIKRKK